MRMKLWQFLLIVAAANLILAALLMAAISGIFHVSVSYLSCYCAVWLLGLYTKVTHFQV